MSLKLYIGTTDIIEYYDKYAGLKSCILTVNIIHNNILYLYTIVIIHLISL